MLFGLPSNLHPHLANLVASYLIQPRSDRAHVRIVRYRYFHLYGEVRQRIEAGEYVPSTAAPGERRSAESIQYVVLEGVYTCTCTGGLEGGYAYIELDAFRCAPSEFLVEEKSPVAAGRSICLDEFDA